MYCINIQISKENKNLNGLYVYCRYNFGLMKKYSWIPNNCRQTIDSLSQQYAKMTTTQMDNTLHDLIAENKDIHENQCINLNPATNIMNPKAEALLAAGLGSRPSLGYPGDKYEMGLEAIEKIEVLTAQLACEVFNARYAEIRLGSGTLANLYAFMATTKPGDSIIVPSPDIGGHVTHHAQGAAGLYGLKVHYAPIDKNGYSIDCNALEQQVKKIRPALLTVGGSLNLLPHPVQQMRKIADDNNCYLHFDAAHMCGLIAGKVWQQPLAEGAHLMSFSTYKSLGGPPSGLLLTNDDELAQRIDHIAFPGLTANFDVAKSAALAMCLLDWKEFGKDYAEMMLYNARALASELIRFKMPVFFADQGVTTSHQFALEAAPYGGGQQAAKLLRCANILSCGIGLPLPAVDNDMNGLRFGTPEITRLGMEPDDMITVASFVQRALNGENPDAVGQDVSAFRQKFCRLSYIR